MFHFDELKNVNNCNFLFYDKNIDESQSTSPDDNASSSGGTEASPRINRFLARLPPDGCEKVSINKINNLSAFTNSRIQLKTLLGLFKVN